MQIFKTKDTHGKEMIAFYPEDLKAYTENRVTLHFLKEHLKELKQTLK